MKKGLKVFVNLALLFVLCIPAFSQPSSRSVETFVMDTFDSANSQNYPYRGETYSWDWTVNASRYVAEGYPKYGYFAGIPNSLKQLRQGDTEARVLGVSSAFNRKGDNWFEVIPMKDGKPYEIPFIGHVDRIDFWAWGANYLYYLEIMVRDSDGRVHVLSCGNTRYNGWKNIIVQIPGWMNQHSRLRSGPESMTFVGFRVRSDAAEYVDDYSIYFDNLKYMSNSLAFIYDGYELKETDFSNSQTGSAVPNSNSSSSTASSEAK